MPPQFSDVLINERKNTGGEKSHQRVEPILCSKARFWVVVCNPKFCYQTNGGQGSKDCSILASDVETGAIIARLENAHENAINSLTNFTESTIASGDDESCIKVWDTRQHSCSNTFNAHEDYVSDMTFVPDSMKLLGARYVVPLIFFTGQYLSVNFVAEVGVS